MFMPDAPRHLLLLTAKLANPEHPDWLSNNLYDVAGSFEASGLGRCTRAHGDVRAIIGSEVTAGWVTDDDVVAVCRQTRPDLIVISEVRAPDVDGHSLPRNLYLTNLHPLTLSYLRYVLKIPLVLLWYDTSGDDFPRLEARYPMVDLHVILDHGPYAPYTHCPEKYCYLWTPQDTRIVNDGDGRGERPIDVSFAGRIETDRYAYRRRLLDLLRSSGVTVYHRPNMNVVSHLPYPEYISIMQRSKITLNCSSSGQLKGRVFEATHCGCLLMEPAGSRAARYFDPGIEYVEYTPEMLAEQVVYYLEHEKERQEMADRGHGRAVRDYSPHAFWMRLWREVQIRAGASLEMPLYFPG